MLPFPALPLPLGGEDKACEWLMGWEPSEAGGASPARRYWPCHGGVKAAGLGASCEFFLNFF